MKKFVLIFIPALLCGVMLSSCKRDKQKGDLSLISDVISEVVLTDREKDEIESRGNVDYDAFVKWVRDSIQKRASNVTNEIVFADREKDEISYREMEEAFRQWVRDQVIQRAEQRSQQAIPRTE